LCCWAESPCSSSVRAKSLNGSIRPGTFKMDSTHADLPRLTARFKAPHRGSGTQFISVAAILIKWRSAMFRKLSIVMALAVVGATVCAASNKDQKRLENSGVVMQEIMNTPENIPQEVLEKADCVIVFPSVLKAAFVVGASYGRGAMVCRTGENFRGPWGAPAMMALEGGSVGFQIGGQATDLVLLVMNDRGASSILNSKVKLGADASVAAGPVGRDAAANTDAYMRAEVLSYSRSRGLFAGISLEGSTLRPDDDATTEVYGHKLTAKEIIIGGKANVPVSGRHLVAVLEKGSPHNESKPAVGN
jgi:lipid-binding SYLF domain-containing protein